MLQKGNKNRYLSVETALCLTTLRYIRPKCLSKSHFASVSHIFASARMTVYEILIYMLHEHSEVPTETFPEFPIWEQSSRPRKSSFVDLMPVEHCFSDFPLCLEGLCRADDWDLLVRFIAPLEPVLCEVACLELPKVRKKTGKRASASLPISTPQVLTGRQVGPISAEERRAKIKRFLEKRNKRTWGKKIVYDCRKLVADHRLRVKGRFVAKPQTGAEPEG